MSNGNNNQTSPKLRLQSVEIQGFRPFRHFEAKVDDLEILVGANGAGKSALFEFLKFLRDGVSLEIPPEIVSGNPGQQVFHVPGPERFSWRVKVDTASFPILYTGEVIGPVGRPLVVSEEVIDEIGHPLLQVKNHQGLVWQLSQYNSGDKIVPGKGQAVTTSGNRLALSQMVSPTFPELFNLREYIRQWRFYGSYAVNAKKIRRPVLIEPQPILHEDAGNLSSTLHYMVTEQKSSFDELQHCLRTVIPGFKGLLVKAYGGRGEVIAFWREGGVDSELTLADLSDGILRLICWCVLCLQPNPPSLICIDEPDQGLHPRTLPLLASLFEKAIARTQIFLATHSSYFLTQFDISRIAVMRKEDGEAKFLKPSDSRVLTENLDDFGPEELELMHRSDELELLA